jgi:hypothetical protein
MSTAFRKLMQDDDTGGSKAKAAATMDDKLNDDEAEEEEDPLCWVAKKIVSEWTNDDGIRCISIIIQLSGGSTLTDSNDAEVQVSTGGDELAISEVWCPLIAGVMHFYTTFAIKAQG